MRYAEILEAVTLSESPIDAYHGTNADFDTFLPRDEIHYGDSAFFHFGTPQQANQRLADKGNQPGARIIPVRLQIKNPLRMKDITDWSPDLIIYALRTSGHKQLAAAAENLWQQEFSKKRSQSNMRAFQRAVRKYRKDHGLPYQGYFNSWASDQGEMQFRKQINRKKQDREREMVKKLLNTFGYDSIVYRNKFEGRGDSYLVFDNSQIASRLSQGS